MRIANRTQHDGPTEWFKIVNKAGSDVTDVFIMDEIGFWGTSASSFVDQLKDISTPKIVLHLNSPGGEVFDGVAIYNALKNHEAHVTVSVEALAASAASFIAQAGDEIVMQRGSTMMIHDGLAFCVGNEADMVKTAKLLNTISNNIADIYSSRAGGTQEEWRALMREEVWYTAGEAVEAGLADEVAADAAPEDAVAAAAKWDLSVFNHAGRSDAPSPESIRKKIISNRAKEAPVAPNLPHAEAQKSGEGETPVAPATQVVPEQPGTPSDPLPEVPADPEKEKEEPKAPGDQPSNSAVTYTGPRVTFLVNGVSVTDASAVQAHIDSLETAQREAAEQNRKDFVKSLAESNKIGASQMSGIEAFALGLTGDQYEAWKATYDAAPVLPLLGQHAAGTSNHSGTPSPVEAQAADRVEVLKGVVAQHKMSGMDPAKIKALASYVELVGLDPEYKL